jgi:cleavage stimulation factor subunit 2
MHGGHHSFQPGPPQSFGGPRYGGGPVMPMQPVGQMNPPPSSAMQTSPSTSAADEEKNQAEMLLKVINLTDEQINLLPPDDRAKVLELRNQLRVKMSNP